MFTLRWGILATGNMAKQFVQDLGLDPQARDVHDITHVVRAVWSSSSIDRARTFIQENIGPDANTIAYGTLDELVHDPEVDVVYISTPTNVHYANVKTCLEAKKPVLCEASIVEVTINAPQLANLIALSGSQNTFLAEALWTRYFPITQHLRNLLHNQKVLGKIHRVTSDLSLNFPVNLPDHSIRDAQSGGGALLAVGVYPLAWVMLALFESPENERNMPDVMAQMVMELDKAHPSDEQTCATMVFRKIRATAVVSCSLITSTPPGRSVLIEGEKGQLTIPWAPHRPESYTLKLFKNETSPEMVETREFAIPGKGLFYQADSVARAIRDGKKQVDEWPLADSLTMMKLLDQIRAQGGLVYPDGLEDV
ncbi:oxidoreductase family, NAD-binding rossmann fold protein [Ceratobasidium sp. AG-Ba]|nr:oxidoreductase family, NAD-binding rossmann fold protein [Ceratobasidium sp. AG-Ba]